MPFKKKKETPLFYSGLNKLKHRWSTVADNINSKPSEVTFANLWLQYLSAETIEDRNLNKLAILIHLGARPNFKMSGEDAGSLDDLSQAMLKTLGA